MAKIKFKKITKDLKEYKRLKALYISAFPKEERDDFSHLRHLVKDGKGEFLAIYIDKTWVGLIWVGHLRDMVLIGYFAVVEKERSKGYGTAILTEMKKRYAGKRMFLNIEEPDPESTNISQRVDRLLFYLKNNFVPCTGCSNETIRFVTLCTNGFVNYNEAVEMYDYLEML